MLYRMLFIRAGKPLGITFWADDMIEATEVASKWEEAIGLPLQTLRSLGVSKFPKTRRKICLPPTLVQ